MMTDTPLPSCPLCGCPAHLLDIPNTLTDVGLLLITTACGLRLGDEYFMGNYAKGDRAKVLKRLTHQWQQRVPVS